FLAAWPAKTPAEQEHLLSALTPHEDDELLATLARFAVGPGSRGTVATYLSELGERIVALIIRLAPSFPWPGVLFVAGSTDGLAGAGQVAVTWALRVPAVPIAVAVPAGIWDEFLTAAPESRAKALLREGELRVPGVDPATVQRALREAGAVESAAAAL